MCCSTFCTSDVPPSTVLTPPPPPLSPCTCRIHADEQLVTQIMAGKVDLGDVVLPEPEEEVKAKK